MKLAALPRSDALRQQLAPLQQRWQALAPRERLGATVGLGLLTVFVVWSFGVQPALKTLRTAPAQLDALDAELQTMQRLAAEARELRNQPPVNPAQSAEALKAATDHLGEAAKLSLQGDRAVLTLNGLGTEALRGWLAEVRSGARARPIEANLTRGANGYAGTIVVLLGAPA